MDYLAHRASRKLDAAMRHLQQAQEDAALSDGDTTEIEAEIDTLLTSATSLRDTMSERGRPPAPAPAPR